MATADSVRACIARAIRPPMRQANQALAANSSIPPMPGRARLRRRSACTVLLQAGIHRGPISA
jgi:hypothetical protein